LFTRKPWSLSAGIAKRLARVWRGEKITSQMKTKSILGVIVFAFLLTEIGFSQTSTTPLTHGGLLAEQKLYEIAVRSYNGDWQTAFRRDGSAILQFGMSGGDIAIVPEGTFSFSEIYGLLIPRLLPQRSGYCYVFFTPIPKDEDVEAITMTLRDDAVIRKMMSDARAKMVPYENQRIQQMLKQYPPLP
jgi:hypothetical protein